MSRKYAHAAEYHHRNNGATTSKHASDCEVWSVIRFLHAYCEMAAEIHLPDLALSDFHQFTSSHEHFAVKRFDTTEEIKAVVLEYLQNLDTEYCRTGLQKLHKRYTECLDLQGDYEEK